MAAAEQGRKTHLNEHLGAAVALGGGAVHRHGLPVAGELQGDVLLHELLDHLWEDKKSQLEGLPNNYR